MKNTATAIVVVTTVLSTLLGSCKRGTGYLRESGSAPPDEQASILPSNDNKNLSLDEREHAVAEAIYALVDHGKLLQHNEWEVTEDDVRGSSAILRSGPGVTTKEGFYYLSDVSDTAAVIRKTGLSGVECSLRRLEGPCQIARVVAIAVLDVALGYDLFIEVMQPMFGFQGEKRDLSDEEISALKEKYQKRYEMVMQWLKDRNE